MIRFIMKIFVLLFAVTLWQVGIFEPLPVDIGGEVTNAEAHHKVGHYNQNKCDQGQTEWCPPPTVSELPIQYMVFSGAALIVISVGMVSLIRKRKMKSSLEV